MKWNQTTINNRKWYGITQTYVKNENSDNKEHNSWVFKKKNYWIKKKRNEKKKLRPAHYAV